ncbi:unnamed protein product [Sphenostylis stenocarpa]|uniref:Uncharacterized protein n=1 Tax=Sphenostylis stenocarpa TaxID=92480 RepID=A0AA86VF80_9FABA|nr:unnamed protein product [Sphenostylis stenocarpa]
MAFYVNDLRAFYAERIYPRSSSKCGWMSATVEVLFQIAQIIRLNELELYFAEDVCTSMEFYSPRNELEALNSIVLLIDKSLCLSFSFEAVTMLDGTLLLEEIMQARRVINS